MHAAKQSYWKPSRFQGSYNLSILFEHKPEIERSAIKFVSDANKNIKFQQYADFLKVDICLHLGSSCDCIQQQWKDESTPSPHPSKTGGWISYWLNWENSSKGNQTMQSLFGENTPNEVKGGKSEI